MRRNDSILFAAALGLCACAGTQSAEPPLQARAVVELARWQILDGERPLGQMLQLEIRDPAGPVRFYQIEDLAGRLVGSATDVGRFSRRVPFREGEQDLGVWALPRGVANLFSVAEPVTLRPQPTAAEANAERR